MGISVNNSGVFYELPDAPDVTDSTQQLLWSRLAETVVPRRFVRNFPNVAPEQVTGFKTLLDVLSLFEAWGVIDGGTLLLKLHLFIY